MASQADEGARALAALNLVRGGGPAAEERLRQRRTTIMRVRIAIILGSIVVGHLIGVASSSHSSPSTRPVEVPGWRSVLGLSLMGVAVVVEIIVLAARARSGERRAAWRSPSLVLSRSQRRRLLRQIRGRDDMDPIMLPITRQLAIRLARQRSLVFLWMGLPLLFVGQAITTNSNIRWTFAVVLTTLCVGLAIQTLRDSRRAGQFRTRYPWAGGEEPKWSQQPGISSADHPRS